MKSWLKWPLLALGALALPVIIRLLQLALVLLLFTLLDMNDARLATNARNAWTATGLPMARIIHLTSPLEISGRVTAFEVLCKDDDLAYDPFYTGLLSDIAELPGWTVAPVSAGEYDALVREIAPEAAFLLPECDFEAHYVGADGSRAFFDGDAGLFIHIAPGSAQPRDWLRDGLHIEGVISRAHLNTRTALVPLGTTYEAVIVPEEQRAALEAELSGRSSWHAGEVTRAEFAELQRVALYDLPPLYPQDITFDWWAYATEEEGAAWDMMLYDAESGLFISISYR